MIANIRPGRISGYIKAPPSKSIAHRAVLAAGLAQGQSRIRNLTNNHDVRATMTAVAQMGADLCVRESWTDIAGKGGIGTIARPVNCCESGSTLRFLIPVLSLTGQQVEFTGKGRLFQRPQDVYKKIFEERGCLFRQTDTGVTVKGSLRPGNYEVAGNVSSQFISGLLFALPLLKKSSTLRILPPFESRPYVEMTMEVLADFGVHVYWDDEDDLLLQIPAPQRYLNREYTVEGDYSQAAFLAVLGALCGGIRLRELKPQSLQGDAVILDILRRCGADFGWEGDELVFRKSALTATTVDLAPCPDLGPILMVLAMFCKGTTIITNAGRLRLKESDRIASMQQELAKFGAVVQVDGDTIRIDGCRTIQPSVLSSHNDHRVAMSLAVAALAGGWQAVIRGAEAVAKSWPGFFDMLKTLGAGVSYQDE